MGVTTTILWRTFRIRYGSRAATCFSVDVDGKRYLVTARHVVQGMGESDTVEIMYQGQWRLLSVRLVGHGQGEVDVSVLAPEVLFGAPSPFELALRTDGLSVSEGVYFLGFPFGMSFDAGKIYPDMPMPLVKSATVSALDFPEDGRLLLDGHNNPGFSGGPVVRNIEAAKPQTVIGVVSGYRFKPYRVRDLQGNEGPYTYDVNTGIVIAWAIDHVNKHRRRESHWHQRRNPTTSQADRSVAARSRTSPVVANRVVPYGMA